MDETKIKKLPAKQRFMKIASVNKFKKNDNSYSSNNYQLDWDEINGIFLYFWDSLKSWMLYHKDFTEFRS